MAAVGIDLGTTNSCVGVMKNGVVQIVSHKNGKRVLPSIISFECNDVIVGVKSVDPKNTAQGVKYLMGRKLNDPGVQRFQRNTLLNLISEEHRLKIIMSRRNMDELFFPEQLSAFILYELKKAAAAFMDKKIEKAVITVPNYFENPHRLATITAGKIAGFKEVRLLNEATAAAIAYGVESNMKNSQRILVYDFGGGTFDVTILLYEAGAYKVLATDGDLELGGEDITNNVMDRVLRKLEKQYRVKITDKRKLARLRNLCEQAKIELSIKESTTFDLLGFVSFDAEYTLTRETFEADNAPIFSKTIGIVSNCLRKANLRRTDIDEVILVGGSTYNTIIKRLLSLYFGKDAKSSISKEEAVAHGATLAAAKWQGIYPGQLSFQNITSQSIGVEIKGQRMDIIIPKYSQIPISKSKRYKTVNENHTNIMVRVFSGENEFTYNNTLLGSFMVSGIQSGPKGNIVKETFTIDESGILKVDAVDMSGRSTELRVDMNDGCFTSVQIEALRERLHQILDQPKDTVKRKTRLL